jgi:DNA-binding NtrC family response regulator/tetratricopeptide (TPR) repeat protein
MSEKGKGAPGRSAPTVTTRLVHPALSRLSRDGRGFATGGPWPDGALRAPENLRDELSVLRFGLGLFTALALLEAEGWPDRPSPSRWAVAPDGLPVLLSAGQGAPSDGLSEPHAALLHGLLAGRRAPRKSGWALVPRSHRNAAGWNAWFREVRGEGRPVSCRTALLALWSLADRSGLDPALPSSWGVAARWSGGGSAPGLTTQAAEGAHALQAALGLAGAECLVVRLGGAPPYPYAALEPLAAAALGAKEARAWMGRHLAGGEETLIGALSKLLGEGVGAWVLHPASVLDPGSLRVLQEAASRSSRPVILLADCGEGGSAAAVRAEGLHLPWLPPVAEAWYLEHARALSGDEPGALLRALEALPPGQPRCGGSLLPPVPEGWRRPARSFLGSRAGAVKSGDPETAAREGRIADLLAAASESGAQGHGEERDFWRGAALMLVGQPALALAAWGTLPAVWPERARLNLYKARARERMQEFAKGAAALKEARASGLRREDLPLAHMLEAQFLWIDGKSDESQSLLTGVADGCGEADLRAQALCHLATQALHDNRIDEAVRYLERARGALPERPQPLTEFLVLHRTGMALRKAGDFARALEHFDLARRAAAGAGFRNLEAWAECERGTVLGQLFRFEEAMTAFTLAAEGAAALGLDHLAASARFNLATCQVEAGHLSLAERTFTASLEEDGAAPVEAAAGWYWMSVVRQRRGDYPGALEAAESGLRALEGFRDPEVRLPLLIARGEVLLLTGQHRKLAYLLRELEDALTPEAEPNDRLAAAALKRAAAAKGEGTFTNAELERAEALLDHASLYFRAHWHLLGAQGKDGEAVESLTSAWRVAREARSAHLACRALWALAGLGALPALDTEDRRWLAGFLSDNRVRGAESGLFRFLGEPSYIPEPESPGLPEDLELLARTESEPGGGFEPILLRLGASCGCAVAPGRPPHWWGGGTAEQRRALLAAAGLRGEAPGPGGRILGHPGSEALWFGILRTGQFPFAAEAAVLFRVWARIARIPEDGDAEAAAPSQHPAVARRILTRSPAMACLLGKVERAAPFAFPVLITGEAGSGKEVCARAIHEASPRAGKAWIAANCANLTPTLAASQLFGHRKGAFTGADRDQVGLVEASRGGTLFLDEVGELPGETQPALLRYLQDGSYTPLGESRERRSDARVVAATNRDLERAVASGRFREDLFHRLCVIPIEVPPLRRRPEDIPLLFDHFLSGAARDEGFPKPEVEPAVLTRLAAYAWPGNVRELQNLARSLLVEAHGGGLVRESHLPDKMRRGGSGDGGSLTAQVEAAERAVIESALRESGGSPAAAARLLGVSRQSLAQKMKRLGVRRES